MVLAPISKIPRLGCHVIVQMMNHATKKDRAGRGLLQHLLYAAYVFLARPQLSTFPSFEIKSERDEDILFWGTSGRPL
jgi:hypothetical protein